MSNYSRFYLSLKTSMIVLLVGSAIGAYIAWDYPYLIIFHITILCIFILAVWLLFVIDIVDEGIRLYRVSLVRWEDILDARPIRLIGLRYIRISRKKGLPYWLPLNVNRQEDLEAEILHVAPAGNPIRAAVESASNKRLQIDAATPRD